jgi:hypothetical protein
MGHETASVSIGWDGNAITSATQRLEIGSSPEAIVQSIMKAVANNWILVKKSKDCTCW